MATSALSSANERNVRIELERLRSFMLHSAEGIWRFELSTPISTDLPEEDQIDRIFVEAFLADCNPAMARMYGFHTPSELLGKRLGELLPPADPRSREYLRVFIRNGYRLDRKDSHELDAHGRPKVFVNSFVGVVERGLLLYAWGIQSDVTEQRLAQQELRNKQSQLELITNAIPALLAYVDTDRRFVFVNDAYEGIAGIARAEIPGRRLVDVLGQPAYETIAPYVDRALGGERVRYEARIAFKDGQLRTIHATYLPHVSAEGTVLGYIALVSDVSHEREAERRLFENEERLRLGLDAGEVGTWDWDIRSNLVTWSNRLYDFHGLERGSFGGSVEEFARLVHPDDAERVNEQLRQALGSDATYRLEFRTIRPSGEVRWLSTTGRVLKDEHGAPVRMLGATIDITDKKRREEALTESEHRLRLALDHSHLGDWSWDVATDLVVLSPRGSEIFGVTPGAPIAWKKLQHLIVEEDRERAGLEIERAVAEGADYDLEYRVIRPDGARVWVAAKGRATYRNDGRVVGMVGIVGDITERKQIEVEREELLERERAARAEAEHASHLKDEFLATLSHELRTPLNAILGWAQLLSHGRLSPTQQSEALTVIDRNARAQAQLIEDLLDMSRIVSGKLHLELEALDLGTVIETVVKSVEPSAVARKIAITRTVSGHPATVLVDSTRIQQVIWNLLTNAVKFTPVGGTVSVRCDALDDRVQLSISDTGQGIASEFLPYVFDRFRQADGSTTRRHGGLGLGLAIVKHLCELHGGRVEAQSDGVGKGATFVVTLPRLAKAHASAGGTQLSDYHYPSSLFDLSDLHVLVVDDDHDARTLLARLLSEYGAEVTAAASTAQALDLLGQRRYALLISDISMPGRDGYDLIRTVRQSSDAPLAELPALALTAFAHADDRRNALLAGFDLHVAKPIETVELLAAVTRLAQRPPILAG